MRMRHAAVVAGLALGLMSGTARAAPVTFDFSGGFENYIIGASGTYAIVAFGAQGGAGAAQQSGLGAEIGGRFALQKGQILQIAVGGQGSGSISGGGGGGTFVITGTGLPLVIAAGGGGGGLFSGSDGSGQAGRDGETPNRGGAGGTNGSGGGGGPFDGAGGGGGFLGNGGAASEPRGGQGGNGYPNLAGGTPGFDGGTGGFGGGGGGSVGGGGGGGGYSGGGGSINDVGFGTNGGGGGSFLADIVLPGSEIALSGEHLGDGFVTLDFVSAVPLPASAPMFGAALFAFGTFSYALRRKRAATA